MRAVVILRAVKQHRLGEPGWVMFRPGSAAPWRSMPILWGFLGAEPVNGIDLHSHHFNEEDRERIQELFPEATVQHYY